VNRSTNRWVPPPATPTRRHRRDASAPRIVGREARVRVVWVLVGAVAPPPKPIMLSGFALARRAVRPT
jgi:hypothetical protein